MEKMKRIPIEIDIFEFQITFEYKTRKGYYREQIRSIKGLHKEDAIQRFNIWVNKQRTIFNAKILDIVEFSNSRQSIAL